MFNSKHSLVIKPVLLNPPGEAANVGIAGAVTERAIEHSGGVSEELSRLKKTELERNREKYMDGGWDSIAELACLVFCCLLLHYGI